MRYQTTEAHPNHRYKTIWISDLHLGTRGCQSDMILEFIN